MSLTKVCKCDDKRNCSHEIWFSLKRRRIAAAPGEMVQWTHHWDKQQKTGRILVPLEQYFPTKKLRGRGSWSKAQELHDKTFLADVDVNGRFWLWWQKQQGVTTSSELVTVSRLFDHYINEYLIPESRHLSKSLQHQFDEFKRLLGPDTPASEVTTTRMLTVLNEYKRRKNSPGTIYTRFLRLHAIFNRAVADKLLVALPYEPKELRSRLPKESELGHRDRRLFPGEENQLRGYHIDRRGRKLRNMSPFLLKCVEMALATGLRRGTIRLLQFEDVSQDGCELHIPASKMKGKRPSVKKLPKHIQQIITQQRWFFMSKGCYSPKTYIFGIWNKCADGRIGEAYGEDFIDRIFQRACRNASIPTGSHPDALHFHDLRAEAACRLWEVTHDLSLVQEFLDHKSLDETQRYINRLVKEKQRQAAEVFEAIEAQRQATASTPWARKGARVVVGAFETTQSS